MDETVRILVVDDSEIFTAIMEEAIAADDRAVLVGVARDGKQGVEMARALRPDVISMDVFMPVMDGLDAVARIMEEAPTSIVMVTAATSEQMAHVSFRAIGSGALDVIAKPAEPADARRIVVQLRLMAGLGARRRAAAGVGVGTPGRSPGPPSADVVWTPGTKLRPVDLVALAISTGGPPVLEAILRSLEPRWRASLVVVQHLSPGFDVHLVEWLGRTAGIPVALASRPRACDPVPPSSRRRTSTSPCRWAADCHVDAARERVDGHRPSGTVLLESVATAYGGRAAGSCSRAWATTARGDSSRCVGPAG